MKKPILALVLAMLMAATLLAGCGGNNNTPSEPAPAASEPEAVSSDVTPEDTSEPEAEPTNAVYDAAYAYFENFPSDKNVVSAADLFEMIDNEDDIFILDIRRPDDYEENHLKGAVNLSFFDMSIAENLDKIPDDKPVIVCCYTGQTASQVTAVLNVAGKMAKNLQSGFNNGVSKADNFEDYLETDVNELPAETFAVSADVQEAVNNYFSEKMALDGTGFANFNISPDDVKEIIENEDDSYYILSIRSADDYAAGHIATAENIPYGLGMQEELANLPMDKKIIVYCYSGQTSSQTTAILRLMGYDAYSMSGGMGNADAGTGWLGKGFEVVEAE